MTLNQCDWCGDRIESDEARATIVKTDEEPGSRLDKGEYVAKFHTELPCFEEAMDYGWS